VLEQMGLTQEKVMRKLRFTLLGFLVMYSIATALGFATYILISPVAMVIAVFTVMPVVCALLIAGYLALIKATPAESARDAGMLVVVWMVLSIVLDALTYIWVVPTLTGAAPNRLFFVEQSPWIWCSYLVLILCCLAGRRLYLAKVVGWRTSRRALQ